MRGLFIGRFQPFHKGHLYVVELMKKECSTIMLGIGSAQKKGELENPLSGGERIEMIKRVLDKRSFGPYELYPIPDIDCYSAWPYYVKTILPSFDVVYANNDVVAELFEGIGIQVKRVENKNRDTWRGEEIRRKMSKGENWKEYVPEEVADYLEKLDMEKRVEPRIKIKSSTERDAAQLLTKNNLTITTAESCTGGLIAHRLTNVPGSSKYFKGGLVTYSNQAKIDLLGVDDKSIEREGVVSEEVAIQMARGARRYIDTDIGVSVTGIAGPGGGTEEKPVGTVHYAIAIGDEVYTDILKLEGNRLEIKEQTSESVLRRLIELL